MFIYGIIFIKDLRREFYYMGHHNARSGYSKLVDRLNKFPQGAPPSDTLFEILKMLFSENEAAKLSLLPVRPFTVKKASRVWGMDELSAEKILENLADRAILFDMEFNGEQAYMLPPPVVGFFEFSMMRVRGDINQKALSELFYKFMLEAEDFVKDLFISGDTRFGRTFVHEPVLTNENALHVLDYERASQVIKTASHIGVSMCYCRHVASHAGHACDAPMDICLSFNSSALSLSKHGNARLIEASEGMDLLEQAYSHNLVQMGENVRENVSFICNCCSCCCEVMVSARKFGIVHPVHTTNFIPEIDTSKCIGCGKCTKYCPAAALEVKEENTPEGRIIKKACLNESTCLGCGVCVRLCPAKALTLKSRPERVVTPVNSTHRVVVMAIERGKLQDLIFDNQAYLSHRAMAAVLGVILKLPPLKQALASKQMKSRYLDALITRL